MFKKKNAYSYMELISQLNILANKGCTLDKINKEMVRDVKKLFKCNGTTLYLLENNGKTLKMKNNVLPVKVEKAIENLIGIDIPSISFPVEKIPLYKSILDQDTCFTSNNSSEIKALIEDYAKSMLYNKQKIYSVINKLIPKIQTILGIKSIIIAPLRVDKEKYGLLEISGTKKFSSSQVSEMKLLSELLSGIIKRKRLEENLEKREREYRIIVENTTDLISVADKYGKFIYASPSYNILGLDSQKLIGEDVFKNVHPEDAKELGSYLNNFELQKNKEIMTTTLRIKDKNGKFHYFESIARVINADTEEPTILSVLRDVSKRKEAEEKIAEYENNLENTIKERTVELEDKNRELEKFNKLFVDREFRIKELKNIIEKFESH